jgi:hypothetical protein
MVLGRRYQATEEGKGEGREKTMYIKLIKELLAELQISDVQPRHVLVLMRMERGTLDSIDRRTFKSLVRACSLTAKADPATVESLAGIYGY